ncbi:MAG: fibronectin type III domain-containing protein, partial [Tannerella sp.]|nr:fibronectin type III domain-containing protein [Tannerella sp.]
MKTYLYAISLIVFCLCSCTENELGEADRLFRPVPEEYTVKVTENTLTYGWKKIGGSQSYTIEVSEDATFESEVKYSATIEEDTCLFKNLRYDTEYYARVRANSADPAKNSGWAVWKNPEKTEARIVPILLKAIAGNDITRSSVTIRWSIDPENPVDGAFITRTGDSNGREILLTASQIAAGELLIEGLESNTAYSAQIFNSKAPEDEKFYNTRTFKTNREAPPGAIIVLPGADLSALIDASTDGDVFFLEDGFEYRFGAGKTITKSISLIGSSVRPEITTTSQWGVSGTVGSIYFDGIDFISEGSNTYLFNSSAAFTLQQLNYSNCTFDNYSRGLFRVQNSTS